MKIILTTRFYRNGQTAHVTDLCTELMRRGRKVLLIITGLHDPAYLRWLKSKRIPFATASNPNQLKKYLRRTQFTPHIIHNHSSHTLELAAALSSHFNVPSVTTVHYLDFPRSELLTGQSAVIFISREMAEFFRDLAVPSYIVENGIPIPPSLRQNLPWRKEALFLAQVTAEKQENFRSMTESLLSWGWKVKSAGNWCYEGIACLGWVNETGPLLSRAKLVIGTGRAIREAMAWGVPAWVLGSYCDGLVTPANVAELETVNFSGRCSKKPFSPAEAEALLKIPSPQAMAALGAFGRERALKHYSIEKMVEKLTAVYQECIWNSGCEKQSKTGNWHKMSKL